VFVVCRIPFVAVDPVEDSAQVVRPATDDIVEAVTEGRGEDLVRVGRADGDDLGGVQDAAFEEVCLLYTSEAADEMD
jgi:hypothetical protein